ncbi:VPA1262 family protein [Cupriavidus sp. 2KB_3]|uniref:VPA1262 family protein n=1 Tax=Cupriavidus sp. 2KB_3 TaxID=3232980 RepID=UPI003F8FAFE9
MNDLIGDPRLGRLFATPGRACALQLWIAQIQTDEGLENRFVYGRLLPYSFSSRKWNMSSDDKFEVVADCRAQVIRVTAYMASEQAGDLLGRLANGDDIQTISSALGLVLPDSLDKRIGDFRLSGRHVCRPAMLLLNRDAHAGVGPQSPHGSASAFSAALCAADKEQLFNTARGPDPEMARFLVRRMNADTGLDFAAKDGTRFGDLELLVFPTLDDHERELLEVSRSEGGNVLVVKLDVSQLPGFSRFFVRAQILNDGQLVFSCLKSVGAGITQIIECVFEMPEGIRGITDSAEVEIHGVRDEGDVATLCCCWKTHYVREISLSLNASSGANSGGEVRLGWLDKALKGSLRNSARVKAAQIINRGDVTPASIVGGRQADPWVDTNRKVIDLLRVLHPPTSEARFFGRLSEGDGTERLKLAEWIKRQFGKYRDHQIIYFDPYFEDAGIGLFVPNASDKGQYVIFTTVSTAKSSSTQIQKPSVAEDGNADPDRIDNLLASCRQLQGLTRGMDLRIFGVKPGALHDRYMLVGDRRGLPVAGFNLSNSIQKANEDHPLLVTPIPMDALHEVFNYATRLIQRAASGPSADSDDLVPIFDSRRQVQPVPQRFTPLDFLDGAWAGTVLSTWTGDKSLRGLHGQALRVRLGKLGWLLGGESLRVPQPVNPDICAIVMKTDPEQAQDRWEVVAELLAHLPHGDSPWHEAGTSNSRLNDFLASYLEGAFLRVSDVPPGASFTSIQSQLFQQDLEAFLRGPYRYEHFHHRIKYRALKWADVFAIRFLWHTVPERLMSLSTRYAVTLEKEANYRDAIKLSLLSQIVGEISLSIEIGLSEAQRESLLCSTNGCLTWLGLASLRKESEGGEGAQRTVARLALLERQARIRALGWILNGFARTHGSETSFNIVRQALFDALPPMLTQSDAEFLVDSLLGHMREMGWSEPWLSEDVIAPLMKAGRVTPHELCGIWVKELTLRMSEKLHGQHVSFQRLREGRVTEVAAFLVARSPVETQGKAIDSLLKLVKKARTNVQQPLASTMNWARWDCSLEVAMWVYALCRHVAHHTQASEALPSRFLELCQSARDIAMVRTVEDWRRHGVNRGALAAFIEEVAEI